MHYAIIAAGEGSRLVKEGIAVSKPLVSICGRPMIRRLADIFAENGAESLSIILSPKADDVIKYIESIRGEYPFDLRLTVKETAGSMQSFHEVSRTIPQGKFVLTTVDTVFRNDDFSRFVSAFEADDSSDGCFAVTPFIDDEKPLYVDTDGRHITAFRDTPSGSGSLVSGGIYGLTSPALGILDRCMAQGITRMRRYQQALLDTGFSIRAFRFPKIVDVDHAADIATAEEFITPQP